MENYKFQLIFNISAEQAYVKEKNQVFPDFIEKSGGHSMMLKYGTTRVSFRGS